MVLRPLPLRKVIRALFRAGFNVIRQKGSHIFLQHPDGRTTIVSSHPGEMIGRGMLRKIIKDIKMDPEEFMKLA